MNWELLTYGIFCVDINILISQLWILDCYLSLARAALRVSGAVTMSAAVAAPRPMDDSTKVNAHSFALSLSSCSNDASFACAAELDDPSELENPGVRSLASLPHSPRKGCSFVVLILYAVAQVAHDTAEDDLYVRFKTLQRQLEFIEIQVRSCASLCVAHASAQCE